MCQYSYGLLLQYMHKSQSSTMLGIVNEQINFQVSPGPPSSIADDPEFAMLFGGGQDAANPVNQKEIYGEKTMARKYEQACASSDVEDTIVSPKKPKLSTSREATNITGGAAVSPPPLDLAVGLDAAAEVSSTKDKSKELASGMVGCEWSVFRMLIPLDNAATSFDKARMEIYEDTGARISIYPHSGIGIVMVWAKKEDGSNPLVWHALRAVLRHFHKSLLNDRSSSPYLRVRLLVPGPQAINLIEFHPMCPLQDDCFINFYLTDTVPLLSHLDVILEIGGNPEGVFNTIQSIASHPREFLVDGAKISQLEVQSTAGGGQSVGIIPKSGWIHRQRITEVSHCTFIKRVCAELIIGKNGENIKRIQQSGPATITIGFMKNSNLMKLEICGRAYPEIRKAREVIQHVVGEVDGSEIFKSVIISTSSGRSCS